MKKTLLLTIFSMLCACASFAQYGRLEPLRDRDTSNMVMRTPKETIQKLRTDKDKNVKKIGNVIESIERQLEFVRGGYLINRMPTMNIPSFTSSIKFLEQQGINVSYYVEEFFTYYPRSGQRQDKTGKAY